MRAIESGVTAHSQQCICNDMVGRNYILHCINSIMATQALLRSVLLTPQDAHTHPEPDLPFMQGCR